MRTLLETSLILLQDVISSYRMQISIYGYWGYGAM